MLTRRKQFAVNITTSPMNCDYRPAVLVSVCKKTASFRRWRALLIWNQQADTQQLVRFASDLNDVENVGS